MNFTSMNFRPLTFFCRRDIDAMPPTKVTLEEAEDGLKAGDYVFLEWYCDAADCDCRRVWLAVMHRAPGAGEMDLTGPLATIGYGWETPEFYKKWSPSDPDAHDLAGVRLEPMQRQGPRAEAVLGLAADIVGMPEVPKRFRKHYAATRKALAKDGLATEDNGL